VSGSRPVLFAPITPARSAFAGIFAVTLLGLLTIGATLPVLPRYVQGPIGAGDVAVGVVVGIYAVTGLACRPLAGRLADAQGRKRVVVGGSLLTALAGLLYLVPAGVPGLIVARLVLGIGEGAVYTAGAAWVVDLAPAAQRGRIIGLYGLAIWGGLSFGPPIGELLYRISSYELVWAFAAAAPLLGALIASRIPSDVEAGARTPFRSGGLIAREAVGPGAALALGSIGFAALAAFIVLHVDERGIGHGGLVFTVFALTVVAMRVVGGGFPDRYGPARCAAAAGLAEAAGLLMIAFAGSLPAVLIGAVAMGAAFSILFPALALLVVNRVPEQRRGIAMGTFTAFFDLGVGLGAPIAGIAASLGGYGASFAFAAAAAVGTAAWALMLGRRLGAVAGPTRELSASKVGT